MFHRPIPLDDLHAGEHQVYELFRFHRPKKIALLTGLSRGTVYSYLRRIADRLPGESPPMKKIYRNHILEELERRGMLCEKSEACAKLLSG